MFQRRREQRAFRRQPHLHAIPRSRVSPTDKEPTRNLHFDNSGTWWDCTRCVFSLAFSLQMDTLQGRTYLIILSVANFAVNSQR